MNEIKLRRVGTNVLEKFEISGLLTTYNSENTIEPKTEHRVTTSIHKRVA